MAKAKGKLELPISRESTLRHRMKPVVFTLAPATPVDTEKCQPARAERLEVHLKGTTQRLYIPLTELLRIALMRGEL